jgi:hypothetical protein
MNAMPPAGLQHCETFEELAPLLDLHLPEYRPTFNMETQLRLLKGGIQERVRKYDPNPEIVRSTTGTFLESSPDELLKL